MCMVPIYGGLFIILGFVALICGVIALASWMFGYSQENIRKEIIATVVCGGLAFLFYYLASIAGSC